MFERQKRFAKEMKNSVHKQPSEFKFDSDSYNQGYWSGFLEGVKATERYLKKIKTRKKRKVRHIVKPKEEVKP